MLGGTTLLISTRPRYVEGRQACGANSRSYPPPVEIYTVLGHAGHSTGVSSSLLTCLQLSVIARPFYLQSCWRHHWHSWESQLAGVITGSHALLRAFYVEASELWCVSACLGGCTGTQLIISGKHGAFRYSAVCLPGGRLEAAPGRAYAGSSTGVFCVLSHPCASTQPGAWIGHCDQQSGSVEELSLQYRS